MRCSLINLNMRKEHDARPLPTYRKTQTQYKCTQIIMHRVVFEPTNPVSERTKKVHHDLGRAVTVICWYICSESFVHLQMHEVELQFVGFSHRRAAGLTNALYSLPSNNDVCTSSVLRMLPRISALIYVCPVGTGNFCTEG
jgi:hypothetical protein